MNVIGDERALARKKSKILDVLNNEFDRAVNFFQQNVVTRRQHSRHSRDGKTDENSVYYMAESASVQDETNPVF